LESSYGSRKNGATQNDPICFEKRATIVLLDKFPIYIASTSQVRDEIARFQFYEPAMFVSVKKP
jgi:hypothetical protein